MKLAVDVSADGHWSAYGLDVRFLSEDACGFFDYELDLGLSDSLETFQAVDDGIYIVLVGLHSWDRLFYGYRRRLFCWCSNTNCRFLNPDCCFRSHR